MLNILVYDIIYISFLEHNLWYWSRWTWKQTFIMDRTTAKEYELERSSNSDYLRFNGLNVSTKEWILLFDWFDRAWFYCWVSRLLKGFNFDFYSSQLFNEYRYQSSKIKFQKYHEVATKKSFNGLLESREIDYKAECLCFQQKLRILSNLIAKVIFHLKQPINERKKARKDWFWL